MTPDPSHRLIGTCPGGIRCTKCCNLNSPSDLRRNRRIVRRRIARLTEAEVDAAWDEMYDDANEVRDANEREHLLSLGIGGDTGP